MHSDIDRDSVIDERYRVEKELGAGAAGAVYLVEDIQLQRRLALKLVDLPFGEEEETIARLQREAKALNRFVHPNIVQVFRIGRHGADKMYLAMEYVEGQSLLQMLDAGPLAFNHAVKVAVQVAQALHYAEQNAVTHRDVKPHNVLIGVDSQTGEEVAKLADFGLCKLNDDQTATAAQLTRTGVALGTPVYMSPEQCYGQPVDVRSDVYSFGCTLFEMLTGGPPFTAETPAMLLMQHVSAPPPRVLELAPRSGLPVELQDVYLKCMAKNPRDRYQSFGDVIAALQDIRLSADESKLGVHDTGKLKKYRARAPVSKLIIGLGVGVLCLALSLPLLAYAATGEQKGLVLSVVAKTVAPANPIPMFVQGLETIYKVNGADVARAAADAGLSRDGLLDGSQERSLALNEACMQFFRKKGQPAHASAFAMPIAFYFFSRLDQIRKNGGELSADELTQVRKVAEFYTQSEVPTEDWIAINHELDQWNIQLRYGGAGFVEKPSRLAMLMHEVNARAAINARSLASGHHYRRGIGHLFRAFEIAHQLGEKEKYQQYYNLLTSVKSPQGETYYELAVRLNNGLWALEKGDRAQAVSELSKVERLLNGRTPGEDENALHYKRLKDKLKTQS